MSGRRSQIKGYFSALRRSWVRSCLRPFSRRIESAGPDVVRWSVAPITQARLAAHTSSRASGSIRLPAHHLLVTLDSSWRSPCFVQCSLGFWRLSHVPLWRLSRRNFSIARLAAQDRKGNARHFVGERHGYEVEGLLLDELLRPHAQRVRMGFAMKQHGMRPHDE